jgi:hypothetical protein
VRGREGTDRKVGWFEVIVGKSLSAEPQVTKHKCFGFVSGYDTKPRRRLFEVLNSQGMQNTQQITFLSDGGDMVRQIQFDLNPQASMILDWFHVTMRLTVMGQMVKGLPILPAIPDDQEWDFDDVQESDGLGYPTKADLEKDLESIKWYLWHGNAFKALEKIESVEFDLELCEVENGQIAESYQKLYKQLKEFKGYIRKGQAYVVNYGDRYRNGEHISSSIAESTVNQVISKRFCKKQGQRWTKKGAHLLLQVRTKVLNEELTDTFQRWYPAMRFTAATDASPTKAAA